ncbi:hypothetical protein HUE56_15325 [Azospirillum oryzae]|uniref:Uncharacterized protein n=1 Tax=Azospirillum oryzae TaxID=286727 RepID=A0A6N1AKF6_9PROT|nr:hypothetical protein HUE56_15325 [Azospirillum oryzae]
MALVVFIEEQRPGNIAPAQPTGRQQLPTRPQRAELALSMPMPATFATTRKRAGP